MKRQLLSRIMTAAITLSGVGLTVLWWRSAEHRDSLTYIRLSGTTLNLATHPDGIDVGWSKDGGAYELNPWWYRHTHLGWNANTVAYATEQAQQDAYEDRQATLDDDHSVLLPALWTQPSHWQHGFGWDDLVTAPPLDDKAPLCRVQCVCFPFWPMVTIAYGSLLWIPVVWIVRYRRRRANRCVGCGYDLRATPARCPECGTASAA